MGRYGVCSVGSSEKTSQTPSASESHFRVAAIADFSTVTVAVTHKREPIPAVMHLARAWLGFREVDQGLRLSSSSQRMPVRGFASS